MEVVVNRDLGDETQQLPTCRWCGHVIDPDTCWCGSPIPHGIFDGHMAVPMGCQCHIAKTQIGFDYFECRTCQFSSVQLSTFTDSELCPLCMGDNGRDVPMHRRSCTDKDIAEGYDARVGY